MFLDGSKKMKLKSKQKLFFIDKSCLKHVDIEFFFDATTTRTGRIRKHVDLDVVGKAKDNFSLVASDLSIQTQVTCEANFCGNITETPGQCCLGEYIYCIYQTYSVCVIHILYVSYLRGQGGNHALNKAVCLRPDCMLPLFRCI